MMKTTEKKNKKPLLKSKKQEKRKVKTYLT